MLDCPYSYLRFFNSTMRLQPQTVMDNSSELCNSLNRIITSANGKGRLALPSTPRPPTVQTADLLGFDVEGTLSPTVSTPWGDIDSSAADKADARTPSSQPFTTPGLFFSADYVPTGGGGEKDETKTVEKAKERDVWSIIDEMTGDEHNPMIADFQTAQFFQEEQDDTQTQADKIHVLRQTWKCRVSVFLLHCIDGGLIPSMRLSHLTRYALDTDNDAASRAVVHRLLDFLVHLKMPHKEAEHSTGRITEKLNDRNLLLTGSLNDAALTKMLRLGYIRDVIVQEWRGSGSPHALYASVLCGLLARGELPLSAVMICSRELSGAVTALTQGDGGAGGPKADIVDKKNNEFLRTLVNLLQDADEASLPAILNCMHFLCDNDPAAQTLLSRFGAPRLLAAHLLRSGMQVRVLLVSLLRTSLSAIIN